VVLQPKAVSFSGF